VLIEKNNATVISVAEDTAKQSALKSINIIILIERIYCGINLALEPHLAQFYTLVSDIQRA
jgi:hypothetical protein